MRGRGQPQIPIGERVDYPGDVAGLGFVELSRVEVRQGPNIDQVERELATQWLGWVEVDDGFASPQVAVHLTVSPSLTPGSTKL